MALVEPGVRSVGSAGGVGAEVLPLRPGALRGEARTVVEALRRRVPEIERRAPLLDASGAFPSEDVALLREIGALEVFGGHDAHPLDLFEALRVIGRANLSVGRIFEGHVNGARLVDWFGDADQRERLRQDLSRGALFGVWNTEPSNGVALVEEAGGAVLKGLKTYATGAGFVDRAVITAADDQGRRQMVVVDGADPARADLAAWNVRGMRATGSGAYDLTGLPAGPGARLGSPGDYALEPRFSAGAWRFAAVQLGGVEKVLLLLRDHLAEGPGPVPAVKAAQFGRVLADVRGAGLFVREAALRAEGPGAGEEAIAVVLLTRGVVERAGLAVMETAARLVGTRAFFGHHPLDQACRDLALYLRQPAPDEALDRAARAFLARDCWSGDPLW